MGRNHKGMALMDMSATLSMDDTWKDSMAACVKPNPLCRVLMPDMYLQRLHGEWN